MKTDNQLAIELKEKWLEVAGDNEVAHGMADSFLVDTLRELGYRELADTFDEISADFWYA